MSKGGSCRAASLLFDCFRFSKQRRRLKLKSTLAWHFYLFKWNGVLALGNYQRRNEFIGGGDRQHSNWIIFAWLTEVSVRRQLAERGVLGAVSQSLLR